MSDDVLTGAVVVGGSVTAGFTAVTSVLAATLDAGVAATAFAVLLPMAFFAFTVRRLRQNLKSRSSRPETGEQSV